MNTDKTIAKNDESMCVASFDLQKVLSTPKAEIGPLYYLSKVCIYNFTIYDTRSHEGYCNIWNETVAQRGSNEIASILRTFIRNKALQGITNFAFYSDNCGGQNRNENVFSMYIQTAHELNVQIKHR